MKFTFEIVESSSVRHTVEADNLMEAENQIDKIMCSGNVNAKKYGTYESNIKLVRISNV